MGEACSTHGRDEKCVQGFSRKLKLEDHFGYLNADGMIILYWILKIEFRGVDWIHLAQDKDQGLALMSTVVSLRVPYIVGNFLASLANFSISKNVLSRGVGNEIKKNRKAICDSMIISIYITFFFPKMLWRQCSIHGFVFTAAQKIPFQLCLLPLHVVRG
jgi:hypothetical protein